MKEIVNIRTVTEFHDLLGLARPEHPLISFIEDNDLKSKADLSDELFDTRFTTEMYCIMYKDKISGSIGYGRSTYDFQEGTIIFSSPGQVLTSPSREKIAEKQGWTLLFHPDLVRRSILGEKIEEYSFFSYASNEALHLSPKEEQLLFGLVANIQEEYSRNIDEHSQRLIVANLELLLNYCMRFYGRQFYSRSNINKDFVSAFEQVLKSYFKSDHPLESGLPSVDYFGSALNMSTNYLSDLLKKETGKSIKEHLDRHVIEKAKMVLLSSDQKISQIAYGLGFEYPQSFTRMFKNKTGMSPNQYRIIH